MKACPLCHSSNPHRMDDRGEVQCSNSACGWYTSITAWDRLPRAPVPTRTPPIDGLDAFMAMAISGAQDAHRALRRGDASQVQGALMTLARALDESRKAQQLTLVG